MTPPILHMHPENSSILLMYRVFAFGGRIVHAFHGIVMGDVMGWLMDAAGHEPAFNRHSNKQLLSVTRFVVVVVIDS